MIGLLQTDEPFGDLRGWLILLIFALPLLGRLLRKLADKGAETKRERDLALGPRKPLQRRERREQMGDATVDLERDGGDAWERLLRGEDPRTAPALPTPVPPVLMGRRGVEPPRSAEAVASAEGPPQGTLVEIETLAASPLSDFAPAPESEESLETSGGDHVVSQFADFSAALTSQEIDAGQALEGESSEYVPVLAFALDDWRRAIISAEVLGAPLALRRHEPIIGLE